MHSSKHFDPQLGIDIHLYALPPLPVPVPCPLPTIHISLVFDPFDYIPIIGGTIQVQGVKRATAGTNGISIHIPFGVYHPTMLPEVTGPQHDDELFMGSMTVVADGDPLSRITMPVLDCNIVGIIFPFRPKKPAIPQRSMVLPTALNIAIPNTVMVGGPPMISIMGMAFKGVFKGLGKLRKSKLGKLVGEKFKSAKRAAFKGMPPGFLKCKVLRAEPVDIRTGAVEVTHEDFAIPGRLPLTWTRRYRSDDPFAGACGHGWHTPADTRLEVDADGTVLFRGEDGAFAVFERLPQSLFDDTLLDPIDGLRLKLAGNTRSRELHLRTKDDLIYVFDAPPAGVTAIARLPIKRFEDLHGNSWSFERREGVLNRIVESGIDDLQGRFLDISAQRGRIHHIALHDPATGISHPLVRYAQDEHGDLVAAYDALDAPRTFAYADHRMVRHTDRVGLSFYYQYDDQARVIHSWGDGGLYDYHFVYNSLVNETQLTDSLGHTSRIKFDGNGLPLCEIDPLDGCTFFEYDDWGRTTAITDPAGLRTEFVYDERGNLVALTKPDGSVVATEYDQQDKVVAIVDEGGHRWQQHFNSRGQLIEQITPLGAVTHHAYDARGQLVSSTNARGAVTRLAYDRHGSLARIVDAGGAVTTMENDGLGRLLDRRDALGRITRYSYDAKGRLLEAGFPDTTAIACEYDAEDQLVCYVDESGHETQLEYVGIGQIARRRQPNGHDLRYQYDTEGRLVGVINQRGERYRLDRDALGRITAEIDYWEQPRRYSYDPAGRIRLTIDPLGRRMVFDTDPLGRVTRKSFSDVDDVTRQSTETFRYDRDGQLVELRNAHALVTRRYDAEGRLLEEIQNGFKVENTYDLTGNRIRRRTSAGNTIMVNYDLLDQPVLIGINDDVPISIEHDALGRVVAERLGRQLQRGYTYDANGLLSTQSTFKDDVRLFETHFEYDRGCNMSRRIDSDDGVDSYRYDPVGRVIEHTDPSGKLAFWQNDPAGTRLLTHVCEVKREQAVGGDEQSYDWCREGTYDGMHYVFDRAGNLIRRRRGGDRHGSCLHLSWDANQRLHQSQWEGGEQDGDATTYGYDPLGRRVLKRSRTETSWFFWDGDVLLGEVRDSQDSYLPAAATNADNKVIDIQQARARAHAVKSSQTRAREYVFRPDTFEPLTLLERSNDLSSHIYFYSNEPNGCPTRLVDSDGQTRWAARYAAWQQVAGVRHEEIQQPIRLQGQYADSETGLSYNRHRYYDSSIGEFIAQDPIGLAGGENIYEYAANVGAWADPTGLTPNWFPGLSSGGRGEAGTLRAVRQLQEQGYEVVGREVSMTAANGARIRADVVGYHPETGKFLTVESKAGPFARLTKNQRLSGLFSRTSSSIGRDVKLRGRNASDMIARANRLGANIAGNTMTSDFTMRHYFKPGGCRL